MSKLLIKLRNEYKASGEKIAIEQAHKIQDLIDRIPNMLLEEANRGNDRAGLNLNGFPYQTFDKVREWAEAQGLQWEGSRDERKIFLFGWAQ